MTAVEKRRRSRGGAMMELVLFAPWIFLLVIGALDWGFYASALISLQAGSPFRRPVHLRRASVSATDSDYGLHHRSRRNPQAAEHREWRHHLRLEPDRHSRLRDRPGFRHRHAGIGHLPVDIPDPYTGSAGETVHRHARRDDAGARLSHATGNSNAAPPWSSLRSRESPRSLSSSARSTSRWGCGIITRLPAPFTKPPATPP